MEPPVCLILAGGRGTRLNVLVKHRAKPAVPVTGLYRLIDFTLSNTANSNLKRVGILTQYLPGSLMDHIGDGMSWDFHGRSREMRILPPQMGEHAKDWYNGTAHAIYKNMDFIQRGMESEVLILSGDHIYNMDYRDMILFHREKRADITVATMTVSPQDARRFGIAVTNAEGRIVEFQEKPAHPRSRTGSMGIYIFNKNVLMELFGSAIRAGRKDIGGDIIPMAVSVRRVFAYPFEGYWRDVGTLASYWESNMEVLQPHRSGFHLKRWNVRTNLVASGTIERPPAMIGAAAIVKDAFISPGCRISGTVVHSILSPGVVVQENAVVEDSIIFHDVVIGNSSRIVKTIADKNVVIGENAKIGVSGGDTPNTLYPEHLYSGLTLIGKNARLPAGADIGRNCLVYPDVNFENQECILPGGHVLSTPG